MSIKGKKLLHVGGALYQVPAIKCAKDNGCFVILVDQNESVPGRAHADVFEKVSTTDLEGILQLAKRHKIDGIMTSASDSSTPAVAYVAQELGLPGNPLKAARTLQAKDLFRQLQKECGIDHPDFRVVSTPEEAIKGSNELGFPIVFKPVDSAGTKGQSVVYKEDQVVAAFGKALAFSKAGRVIIETFLKADMMELDGDVLVKDGALAFRHYGHNFFMKNRISNVPCGETFPGYFGNEVSDKFDEQFRAIISKLGLRTGCMNFDGLVSDGKAIILDIGLRHGGNFIPEMIQLSSGFDMLKAAIYGALGVNYPVDFLASPNPKPAASYLVPLRVGGILEEVIFSDEIKDFIKEYRPFFHKGDRVYQYTRSDMAMGCLFMQFPDMATMKDRIERIESLVTIRFRGQHNAATET